MQNAKILQEEKQLHTFLKTNLASGQRPEVRIYDGTFEPL